MQDVTIGGPPRKGLLTRAFESADLILSVSRFNTDRLIEHFPETRNRIAHVPNAAEEIFFGQATAREREAVRLDLGLSPTMPYLLSVASFQARKNLAQLINAVGKLREVVDGELALVLLGDGSESEGQPIREAITALGRKAVVKLPGYRQARGLLASLRRGNGPRLRLDHRELRHPRRRGDGPANPRRPGQLDGLARSGWRGWLVLRSDSMKTRSPQPSATSSTAPTSEPGRSSLAGRLLRSTDGRSANDELDRPHCVARPESPRIREIFR